MAPTKKPTSTAKTAKGAAKATGKTKVAKPAAKITADTKADTKAETKAEAKHTGSSTLHYNKQALLKDYSETYTLIMKVGAIFLGIVLVYFMVLILILGNGGHTKHQPFFTQFKDRFTIEYDGTKLPMYGSEKE